MRARSAVAAAHEDAFAPDHSVSRPGDDQVRVAVAVEIAKGRCGGGLVRWEDGVSGGGLAQAAAMILEEMVGPTLEAMPAIEVTRVADVHVREAIAVEIDERERRVRLVVGFDVRDGLFVEEAVAVVEVEARDFAAAVGD